MNFETKEEQQCQQSSKRDTSLQQEALRLHQARQGYSDLLRTQLQRQRSQTHYLAVYQLANAQAVLESLKKSISK